MATEVTGRLRSKDGSGNEKILYPKMTTACIIGLDSYVTGITNSQLTNIYKSMGYGHLVITGKWPEGTPMAGMYVKGIITDPVAFNSSGVIDMWVEAKTYSLQVCESDGTYAWEDASVSSKSATVTVGNTTNVTITGTATISDGNTKVYYKSTTLKFTPRVKSLGVNLTAAGGGGSGGSHSYASTQYAGDGGGGGGYAYDLVYMSSFDRKAFSVVVGAGGDGGDKGIYLTVAGQTSGTLYPPRSGSNGGDSRCGGVTAYGGKGGDPNSSTGGKYGDWDTANANGGHNGGWGLDHSGTSPGKGGKNGYELYADYSWTYGDGGQGGYTSGDGYTGNPGSVWLLFHMT